MSRPYLYLRALLAGLAIGGGLVAVALLLADHHG